MNNWTIKPNHRDNTYIFLKLNADNKIEWKYMNVYVRFKGKNKVNYDVIDSIQEWLNTYVHEKVILDNINQRKLVDENLFDVVYFDGKKIADFFPDTEEYSVTIVYPLEYDY